MSIDTYERKLAKVDLYKKLAEVEKEIKNGEILLDGEEVFKSYK